MKFNVKNSIYYVWSKLIFTTFGKGQQTIIKTLKTIITKMMALAAREHQKSILEVWSFIFHGSKPILDPKLTCL